MIIHVVRNTEYGEDLKAFTSYQAAVQFTLEDAKGYEESLDEEERQAWRQSIIDNDNEFYRINTLTLETGA
jgi:hypothetical protein